MKINFEHQEANQKVDNSKTTYSAPFVQPKSTQRGFRLDISGNVMENKAYASQGKTIEDVMNEAQSQSANLVNKRNYMTVMSNSMSAKDFAKMQEEGFYPASIDVDSVATIVDKIKATLLKSGVHVAGFTDDLSMEQLEHITGSVVFAKSLQNKFNEYNVPVTEENAKTAKEAFDKASNIKDLSDSAKKYIITNREKPSIDNLYRAQFSTGRSENPQSWGYFPDDMQGYYSKKADNLNFDKLEKQMGEVIADLGLEVNEKTIDEAKWLVEKGIPLMKTNLSLLHQLNQSGFPRNIEDILGAIADSISQGKRAGEALLTEHKDSYEKAMDLKEAVEEIEEDALERVAVNSRSFTLRNIIAASNEIKSNQSEAEKIELTDAAKSNLLTAQRQLEEIRLMMTVEANLKLMKSGFSIDTASISRVVEKLKEQEVQDAHVLFGEDGETALSRAALYEETLQKVKDIKEVPADVVGRFIHRPDADFTLNFVHREGLLLKSTYDTANRTYEALMTAPRSDLGDRLKTAFGNIDSMLEDMELDITEDNRRAIRILAYNRMSIDEKNVTSIKSADETVKRVVEKMTPAATLSMIREGVNPLEMNLEELYAYLKTQDQEEQTETEKFSKFIYKMEKSNEITKEEKEACIGIYRLIRQVEKGDGAAIGALVESERELSLQNLLEAVRTKRKGSFHAKADDSLGELTEVKKKGTSITEQITGYFEKKIDFIHEQIAPEKLDIDYLAGENTLEELEILIRGKTEDQSLEESFLKEQVQDMRQISQVSDEAIESLLEFKQPVTANNLLAMDYLMNHRGNTFRQIGQYAQDNDRIRNRALTEERTLQESFSASIENLQDAFDSKEEANAAYEAFVETAQDILEENSMDFQTEYIDVKSMAVYAKQLVLAKNLAREENYEIPVQLGDELTAINLKIIHNANEAGKVTATMETLEIGKVAAEFFVNETSISGYVGCSSQDGLEILHQVEDSLKSNLSDISGKKVSINFVQSSKLDLGSFGHKEETIQTSGKELYNVAKAFLHSIRNL